MAWSYWLGGTTWSAATSRRPEGAPIPAATVLFLGPLRRHYPTLPLPQLIHRMTDRPAQRFGLVGRGRIAPGYHADLVVFDPDTVTDRATYTEPVQYPEGISLVVVNGVVTVEEDWYTGALAGRAIP
ncbi:MAG: amidohydrolase family protein [Armatimonadetes bacterium]|nr:amidohydrolase family protein [Armatimonadota bacterium]